MRDSRQSADRTKPACACGLHFLGRFLANGRFIVDGQPVLNPDLVLPGPIQRHIKLGVQRGIVFEQPGVLLNQCIELRQAFLLQGNWPMPYIRILRWQLKSPPLVVAVNK